MTKTFRDPVDDKIMRRVVRCDWRCLHCREIVGSENVAVYCSQSPREVRPSWFFAAMSLLDHLRDCRGHDYSAELRQRYGSDFLNDPRISEWFREHGVVNRTLLREEELEEQSAD